MISEATVKSFELLFKICSLLKIGVYKWKLPDGDMEIAGSGHLILGFVNYAVLCGTCLNLVYYQVGLWYTYVAAISINNLLNIQQIMQCFRRLLVVHRDYCDRYCLEVTAKDTFAKLIRIFVRVAIPQSAVFVVPFFLEPMSRNFLYRFIFSGGKYSWSFWFYNLIEFYITLSSWFPPFLQSFIVAFHALSCTYWLEQMRYGKNQLIMNDRKTVSKMYQTWQLLMAEMNSCFSPLFWPTFITGNIFLHTYCTFAALKLHETLQLEMYFTLTSYALGWAFVELVMYRLLGNIHGKSQDFIKSWTGTVSFRNRKLLESFRPLGIRVGSMYVIRESTALTIILIVSNLVVQAVLLHR
ncbi:unnamed protein product [Allacma fusca]|uniref:Uncharacterized protein n=1 Tax=Allacma fusca TaxID=39272 RepID=A0A8J2KPV4_9HEXA|nr:unnamed protein product [Allacma fusca]